MLEQKDPRIIPVKVEDEIKTSYIDYSMSVNLARAIPDVRDGLKPSQRRILVSMNDLNLVPGRGFRKCAKIAGETLGNYHPHGDIGVYDTLVHMTQEFRMRYPMVDGQGNFGSIDGYPAAAMRYTEARLSNAAVEMLTELDRDTVDYVDNYDETLKEPAVLPARFPNLLCNGSVGIGVGMATKIPPHNVGEVVDALTALIDNPEIGIGELMEFVVAPDFPTGGVIYGAQGVRQAYWSGRGMVYLRARAEVESRRDGREDIVVTEIPFLVDKSILLQKMADLVRQKTVEGISNIRDESGRHGLRIVIELKRDAHSEVVLNQLFSHSMLQTTFGVMMLAVVKGRPQVLNLKQMLEHYVEHRHAVVLRRTRFDLNKAEARAHILAGLRIALDHIDEVIELIRASANPEEARGRLMEQYELSEIQAQAILSMPLSRLTGLERDKIEEEYQGLLQTIETLKGILESREKQMAILKEEIADIKERFGDERRTEIVYDAEEFVIEDLIAQEDMVVTISREGYVKRMSPSAYRVQGRGGRGVTGMKTRDEDFVEHLFIASTHSYILFLTSSGQCYWLKVYRIPVGERTARGRPVVNLLEMGEDDVSAVVPVREFVDNRYLFTATRKGVVKRTVLSAYGNIRRDGIKALKILEGDGLIGAAVTDGEHDILLVTRRGMAVRFSETDVRAMGRVSTGVKGVDLSGDDEVVAMVVLQADGGSLLTLCENGYGKRTVNDEYPRIRRGGKGVIDIKTTQRNGPVVACKQAQDDDEVMVMTQNGIMIRLPVGAISLIGRNTQGVKVINVDSEDRVIDMTRIVHNGDVEADGSDNGAVGEEDPGNGNEPPEAAAEAKADGDSE